MGELVFVQQLNSSRNFLIYFYADKFSVNQIIIADPSIYLRKKRLAVYYNAAGVHLEVEYIC